MGAGRGRGGGDTALYMVIGGGCCAIIIAAIVLIAVSFSVLEPNDYGLQYDGVSMTLNTGKVFEGGTYFLGVGHKFIKYPRTQQTIKFSSDRGSDGAAVPCRTAEGLQVTIAFAFNYQLKSTVDELSRLYLQYGENEEVENLYRRIAKNVVRSVTAKYNTFSLFTDRSVIQADMLAALNADISKEGALVQSFQLLDVGIPAAFADARTRQESAVQEITRAQNDRTVANINADTRVQRALQEAALIISQARNNATAIALAASASIQSLGARYAAERQAYQSLRQTLGLSTKELLSYIWLDAQNEALGRASIKSVVNLAPPQGFAATPN